MKVREFQLVWDEALVALRRAAVAAGSVDDVPVASRKSLGNSCAIAGDMLDLAYRSNRLALSAAAREVEGG
jgi:hypothetical protein